MMDRLKTPFRPPTRVMEAAGIRRSGRQVNQLKRRVEEDGTGEKGKPAVRRSESSTMLIGQFHRAMLKGLQ